MKGMKKPLALLLALVMAFSLLSVGAWADLVDIPQEEPAQVEEALPETPAEDPAEAPAEPAEVPAPAEEVAEAPAPAEEPAEASEDEAVLLDGDVIEFTPSGSEDAQQFAALPETLESGTYKLSQDVTGATSVTIPSGVTATLDLNGKSYSTSGQFNLAGGTFKLTGSGGTLNTTASYAFGFGNVGDVGGSSLTIDGGVTVKGKNGASIDTRNNTITLNGTLDVTGYGFWTGCGEKGDKTKDNNKITIGTSGVITAGTYGVGLWGTSDTLEISGKVTSPSYVVFTNGQPNNGSLDHWSEDIAIIVHSGAEIKATNDAVALYLPGTGTCEIDGGAITGSPAIYLKSAALNITGGTFKSEGPHKDWEHNGNGASSSGSAVVVEKATDYRPENFSVSITGGTFESKNSEAVASYTHGVVDPAKFITGGTFKGAKAMKPELYADGYYIFGTANDEGVVLEGEVQKITETNYTSTPAVVGHGEDYFLSFPTELTDGTYTLYKDVTLGAESVQVSGDVTLDLNGNNVTSGVPSKTGAFQVQVDGSNFTIQNSGETGATISAPNGRVVKIGADNKFDGHNITVTVKSGVILDADADGAVAIYGEDSAGGVVAKANASQIKNANNKFTLEPGAKITGDEGFGIGLFGTGNEVHIYGSIETGSYAVSSNGNDRFASTFTNLWSWTYNCSINVYEGASIKTPAAADIPAVYLPGSNLFNMTGGSIEGNSAIYNKATTVNISGGVLKGTGAYKDYTSTSNGALSTGDALVMDSEGATYAMGTPKAIIAGNVEISSDKASAVGSYAKANATNLDGSDTARVTGFIGVGVKLTDAADHPTDEDLLAANCSIDSDGVVTETVEKTETVKSVSITVSTPSSAAEPANGNAAQGSVDLTAINFGTALADETLTASDTVKVSMSAEQKASSSSANSIELDIHPVYQVNDGEKKPIGNDAIYKKLTVKLPGFLTGKLFKALWHWEQVGDDFQWVDRSAYVMFSNGDLIFQAKEFSDWKVDFTTVDKSTVKPTTLEVSAEAVASATQEVQTAGNDTGTVYLDDASTSTDVGVENGVVTIYVKSDTDGNLSAYDFTVEIPKGLDYVSTTIPVSKDVTKSTDSTTKVTTLRFQEFGESSNGKTDAAATKNYPVLVADEKVALGTITVRANKTDAVYNTLMEVKVKDVENDKMGATGIAGEINVTVSSTTAKFKLMKTWAATWDLDGGTGGSQPSTVGHNTAPTGVTNPSRDGYTFDKWSPSVGEVVTKDTAYTASWNLVTYTITFADEDGLEITDWNVSAIKATKTGGTDKAVSAEKKLTYTIEDTIAGAVTKTAYTFVSWKPSAATGEANNWGTAALTGALNKTGMYGNVTLTADWTATEYTVTFVDPTEGTPDYAGVKAGDAKYSVTGGKLTYTIEDNISGDPSLTNYSFVGWTVTDATNTEGTDNWTKDQEIAKSTALTAKYGNVKLTTRWNPLMKYAFADYKYGYNGEMLMLVDWTADAGKTQKLTFSDSGTSYELYKTANENYRNEFKTKAAVSDAPTVVYVTIVPASFKTDTALINKFAITDVESGGENANLDDTSNHVLGDVIAANGTITPDKQVSLADLSNANDLFADDTLFNNNEIGILGRLNADYNKDVTATIDDLIAIMNAIG